MGLFSNQLLDVIEWNETRNDVLFWKWKNSEIKKNSRLIIRPGQDAIFMHNGKVEGVFTEEGNYEITDHALQRMNEREIDIEDVETCIIKGETIEFQQDIETNDITEARYEDKWLSHLMDNFCKIIETTKDSIPDVENINEKVA